MKSTRAFTLLELLIAITLSSFIMMGMMQLQMGVIKYIERAREIMITNRKVCLLFNQLQRDLSTAYIPFLAQEIKQNKDVSSSQQEKDQADFDDDSSLEDSAKEDNDKSERRKERKQAKEVRKTFFIGTIDDRIDTVKIEGKRFEFCKMISFITTNALQVYGEKRCRLVRVVYQVVVDKEKGTRENPSYKILRKESYDLFNTECKTGEYGPRPDSKKEVRSYVVADDVKGLYVEYTAIRDKKDGKVVYGKKEQEEMRSQRWGDLKERQGMVPQNILVWLDLWDDAYVQYSRHHLLFPIISFPTINYTKKKKPEKADKPDRSVKAEKDNVPQQEIAIPQTGASS